MKKRIVPLVIVLSILFAVGIVLAADEGTATPKPEKDKLAAPALAGSKPVAPPAAMPPMPPPPALGENAIRDREALQKRMEQQRQAFASDIDELKAILKTAEEEKALKTTEMLKKLIEQKETRQKEAQKQREEWRQRAQQRMQERQQELDKGAPAEKPAVPKGGRPAKQPVVEMHGQPVSAEGSKSDESGK